MTITKLKAVLCWLLVSICSTAAMAGGGHPHGSAGHDDAPHEPDNLWRLTHFSETAEAYVSFPPLVAGSAIPVSVKVTKLADFKPLANGIVNLYLRQEGKTVARFRVKSAVEPGVFALNISPRKSGEYDLFITAEQDDFRSEHSMGQVRVFSDENNTQADNLNNISDITYSKEQQWNNPFALSQTQVRKLRPSVSSFGTVVAPPQSSTLIRSPSDGFYSSNKILRAGQVVTANTLLGYLIPRFGEGSDYGDLVVAKERARAQYQLAKADEKRLKDLYQQGAIPLQRYEEAQQAFEVAKIELSTAESRIEQRIQYSGNTGIALRTPITGTITQSYVRPGSFVEEGDLIFSVSRENLRWLKIQVPEKFAEQLSDVSGAWIESDGQQTILDTSNGASIAEIDQQIDPKTRTVAISIEYPSEIGPSLIGKRVATHLYTQQAQLRLSIHQGAVIDDAGRPVVYVQTSGETFSRRNVELGIQDGAWIEVLNGLQPGDRVVSVGAYFVKLASTGSDAIGHGHAH